MLDIYAFLRDNNIQYTRFDHPPVFTCDEAKRLCPKMPGVELKNLFLRDKNGERHFLVVVGYNKNADLKELKGLFGVSKLSFASPEHLKKYLGVEPGSVSLLGIVNDNENKVEVFIDKELWGNFFQCHPLINTATLTISPEGIRHFFDATKHQLNLIEIPGR